MTQRSSVEIALAGQRPPISRTQLGLTSSLIERASSLEWSALPPDVVVHARHCLLDWVGTTLAGAGEPVSVLVRAQLAVGGPAQASTVVGVGSATTRDAALANGVAGHALDFDDVLLAASSHVTAVVMPAALAAAERSDASGDELLTAFIAGFELVGDLGSTVGEQHYAQGFHATATLGSFGAAASVAWLSGLDPDEWQHALGLAATTAAGLKSMFGTMAKPFHAGWAAHAGVLAADLAGQGFTAAHDAFERSQGFADAHQAAVDMSGVGSDWNLRTNLFKFHPACFLTHSSIDAARQIRDHERLNTQAIERVVVRVNPGHLKVCNISWPTTGAESKFSLRYAVASALSADVDLWNAFSDEGVAQLPDAQLADRIVVEPTSALPREISEVEVWTSDGRRLVESRDVARELVEPDLVARELRLSEKFLTLTTPLLGTEQADHLRSSILTTGDDTSVRELVSVLRDAVVPAAPQTPSGTSKGMK